MFFWHFPTKKRKHTRCCCFFLIQSMDIIVFLQSNIYCDYFIVSHFGLEHIEWTICFSLFLFLFLRTKYKIFQIQAENAFIFQNDIYEILTLINRLCVTEFNQMKGRRRNQTSVTREIISNVFFWWCQTALINVIDRTDTKISKSCLHSTFGNLRSSRAFKNLQFVFKYPLELITFSYSRFKHERFKIFHRN